ncbi:MAG: GHKL domain-containing protein [Lachnospiraceae bacterium]|nr:GHKL domain-containing protein [Lachnospiraceae bacterium]
MTLFEDILYLICSFLNIYLTIVFFNQILESSKKGQIYSYITALVYWIISSSCYLVLQKPSLNLITTSIGIVIIALFIFHDKMWKKLIAVISIYAIRLTIDNLLWLVFSDVSDHVTARALQSILEVFLLFVFEMVIFRLMKLREGTHFSVIKYLLFFLLIVAETVMLICITAQGRFENRFFVRAGLTVVIILNLLIIQSCIGISNDYNYRERWEKRLLEQKALMYENQLNILCQSKEKTQALRHDLKNHLHLLAEYEKSGKREEAISYIEMMMQSMNVEEEIVASGNEQVDAILNYMLKKADEMGTELSIQINVPKTPFCSDYDLNILLSNLLENALEALESCEKKQLKLIMELEKGILYLEIANTYAGMLKTDGKRYLTRKKNADEHGLGLRNVQRVVEQYCGTMELSQKDNIFHVKILLLVGMEE